MTGGAHWWVGSSARTRSKRCSAPVEWAKCIAGREGGEGRARLWREARAAASSSHPGICQIHEIAEADDHLFVVMELLEGEPLESRIADGPFELGEAVRVAIAMLGPLDALHSRGIVHRDLEPSNVFLTRFGVKLLDFGLARAPHPVGDDLSITQTGTSCLGRPTDRDLAWHKRNP